jgi:hypothetical protein
MKINVAPCDNMEVENVAEAFAHGDLADSGSVHESSKSGYQSNAASRGAVDAYATTDEGLHTYYFRASTITVSHIR